MSSKYPIHPKADAYRRMHDYEFEVLVEGIRTNGLLVPITLAKWVDKKTKEVLEGIIDGKNREDACAAAGAQPEYQHFVGSGEDGVATEEEIAEYILQSVTRKNHTLDQQAMGLAILYPEGGIGLHKPDPVKDVKFTSLEQKEYRRVQFARYVQSKREDLVPGIVNGTEKPLYKIAQEIRNAIQKEEKAKSEYAAALKKLREAAPDLARDVDDQTLDLKTAQKELKQRLEDEAEEKAKLAKYEEDLAELRQRDAELAQAVDDGELSLDDAIEQRNDAIAAAEALKRRLMSIHKDLADAVRNGEMTIEDAEQESKKRSIEARRNDPPPDLRQSFGKWMENSMRSSMDAKQVVDQLEEYEKYRDRLRTEDVDVIILYAMMAHERWLKVVNLLRGETDQKRHLNVVGGDDK